ncbi:MAG: DUF4392 domain-containing protein [Chloroflexi bacterium]|nr:DUF4392 domain-containing protein [Chloroflexota bacterium]
MTIEDIILDRDRRGVTALRPHLPADYCDQAARLILDNPGTAIIVNGFYILAAGKPETDGPPGAVAIGNALQKLGYTVVHVTDQHTAPLMKALVGPNIRVVDFPITDDAKSKRFADDLLSSFMPSVVISIERCGLTNEGLFRNMLGRDITRYNARTDYLFHDHPNTVGIGDGGNEIGMGNLADIIPTVPTLVKQPCVTKVARLVISSVSNWGGYGLVASLSKLSKRNLLPSIEEDERIIKLSVDNGAVDGITTEAVYKVDGFTLEENSVTLQQLHDLLAKEGIK